MERKPPDKYPGEFIRVVIGSTIHGLSVPGTDDLDLMGVCIEPAKDALNMSKPFEQHVWRTQPEGVPSEHGDVDLTVYSLRKFLRLAAKGNPTILNLLFVPEEYRHIDDKRLGSELRALIPHIVSKEAGFRYAGYLRAQRERLTGERGQKHTGYTRRLKYMTDGEHSFDSKYAMHMIRLGVQGVELLATGSITLPMDEHTRELVYSVRMGELSMEACVQWANSLELDLLLLARSDSDSPLPERPSWDVLNEWLVGTYLREWE